MPFDSEAQARWMFANKPEMAKEWAKDTDFSKLPEKVKKKKKEEGGEIPSAKNGIHIKPENKGKFTEYKKRTGKTTEEALHSKDPHVRKMANFAKNAKKWKHQEGGTIDEMGYRDDSPYKNRKSIDINTPSGLIDMSKTGMPIVANGVVLEPYSGLHLFPTDKVKETPLKKKRNFQNGGNYDDYMKRMWGTQDGPVPINPDAITPIANPNYNPNQASTATPEVQTIDTSDMKAPTSGAKKKGMGYNGAAAVSVGAGLNLFMGIANAILGKDQPRKVIDNTLAYNPYPQGTGSQAIFQDGGLPSATKGRVPKDRFLKDRVNSNYGFNGVINYDGKPITAPSAEKAIQVNLDFMKNNNPYNSNIYKMDASSHHSINIDGVPKPSDNPMFAQNGGKFDGKGLVVHNGGKAEQISENPFDGGTGEFIGKSHKKGGIEASFQGKPFEVENEPYRYTPEGSLEIFGDMVNPITGNKFKKDSRVIADKEKKAGTYMDKGLDLVTDINPSNSKWDRLKFNSGSAMLRGGLAKQKELAESKEHLSLIQRVMLEQQAEEDNKAKNGGIFQDGGTPWEYRKTNKDKLNKKILEFADLAASKGLTGYSGAKSGYDKRNTSTGRPSRHGANQALDMIFSDPSAYDKIMKDKELSSFLYNNGLTAINEYDPKIAAKTGATTGHVHIGYDRGTPTSDKFRNDYVAQYKPSTKPSYLAASSTSPYKGASSGDAYTEVPTDNPLTGSPYTFNRKLGEKAPPPEAGAPIPTMKFDFKQPNSIPNKPAKNRLPWEQIIPVIPGAFDQVDNVDSQSYQPELYTPYQVSFQDRINAHKSTFNALAPSLVNNPEAQSVLAGQEYAAESGDIADEFRTNQGIINEVTNKNVSLINDAKLKNIQLRDTQQVRQAQALGNTKDRRTAAGIQIGDILAKNSLENKTAAVYQQLYKDYAFDKNMQLQYVGDPNGADRIDQTVAPLVPDSTTTITNSKTGTTTKETYKKPDYTPVNLLDNYRKDARGKLRMSKIAKLMYPTG